MKKVLLLILTVFMLLAFTSCDGAIDFMGKMGQNIAGTDTKGAQEAANKATVSDDQVKSADEDDRINKEESKIVLDGKEITVSGGLSKVESLLPQIEKDTVDSINKALRNEQSTNVLVSEMKQPVTGPVKTAAQGTATVMNAVLETISGSIPADSDDPAMNAVRDAIDSLSESLTNISNDGEVSKGDVVTLQLIENFATEAAKCVNTETGEVNTDDISSLISQANTLATVTTSLSSASQFTLDLGELISSITGSMGGNEGDTSSRSIMILNERQSTNSVIDRIESYDLTDYAATIRSVYASVKTVLGSNTDYSMTTLSLHKSAYEAYANLASSSDSELNSSSFARFATYDGLMKYAIASILSEADRYYTLLTDTSSNWLNRLGLSGVAFPKDIWTVLTDLEAENEWLLKETSGEVRLSIPEKYEDLVIAISNAFGESKNTDVEAVFKDFLNKDRNTATVSCIKTLQFMLGYVSIDGIGDFDINGMLKNALDWLNPNQN